MENGKKKKSGAAGRARVQWLLLPIVVVTIGLGWKYPLLGYSVPVVMLTGLVGSMFRGRWVCGNLCPRGSFLDRLMPSFRPRPAIPAPLRSPAFRWSAFALLMGFLLYRGFQHPADPLHWGNVFWVMCVVTTALALVLALLYHPRTWCSFCPMGTMQSVIGGSKGQLRIDADACRGCRLCEKSCSFDLAIVAHRDSGRLPSRDCLKCSECIAACPTGALSWPGPAGDNGKKTNQV
ncbi:MAG: 4Fe-4S binding protein [Thermodesulfobacteriota bacterium]